MDEDAKAKAQSQGAQEEIGDKALLRGLLSKDQNGGYRQRRYKHKGDRSFGKRKEHEDKGPDQDAAENDKPVQHFSFSSLRTRFLSSTSASNADPRKVRIA